MSQYPTPYSQPQPSPYGGGPYAGPPAGYYPPAAAGSPAARRAGLLIFILGPVVLLMGGCFICVAAALPAMSRQPSTAQQVDDLRAKLPLPPGLSLEAFLLVIGIVVALPGIALLALGAFVRRGRRWAIITALVITGLVLLWLAANVISAIVHVGSDGNQLVGGCVGIVFASAFGLLAAWLIAALRSGPGVDPYQEYLSQYYYHQQMAQAYGTQQQAGFDQGGGYGYGAAPAPPQAAPGPPAQPPAADSAGGAD
jgi:hypothetical protein